MTPTLQAVVDQAAKSSKELADDLERNYKKVVAEAERVMLVDKAAADANAGDIQAATAAKAGEEARLATLRDACKRAAFDGIRERLISDEAQKIEDDKKIKAAADKNKAEREFKTASEAGSNCAIPTSGDVKTRPVCKEGLCCGAAQRLLRDGTKLTVETCQLLDAKTYDYYPPIAAGATSAPAAEKWRFQCIAGAQKLVAAATAALAASYMMA